MSQRVGNAAKALLARLAVDGAEYTSAACEINQLCELFAIDPQRGEWKPENRHFFDIRREFLDPAIEQINRMEGRHIHMRALEYGGRIHGVAFNLHTTGTPLELGKLRAERTPQMANDKESE